MWKKKQSFGYIMPTIGQWTWCPHWSKSVLPFVSFRKAAHLFMLKWGWQVKFILLWTIPVLCTPAKSLFFQWNQNTETQGVALTHKPTNWYREHCCLLKRNSYQVFHSLQVFLLQCKRKTEGKNLKWTSLSKQSRNTFPCSKCPKYPPLYPDTSQVFVYFCLDKLERWKIFFITKKMTLLLFSCAVIVISFVLK